MQGFTNIIFPPASFQIPSGHCSKGRRGREEVKANNNQKKKDKKTKILEPDSTILIRANRFQEREELKQRGENGEQDVTQMEQLISKSEGLLAKRFMMGCPDLAL